MSIRTRGATLGWLIYNKISEATKQPGRIYRKALTQVWHNRLLTEQVNLRAVISARRLNSHS